MENNDPVNTDKMARTYKRIARRDIDVVSLQNEIDELSALSVCHRLTVLGQAVLFVTYFRERLGLRRLRLTWHKILTEKFVKVLASYDVFTVSSNLEMMFSTVWPAASAR